MYDYISEVIWHC